MAALLGSRHCYASYTVKRVLQAIVYKQALRTDLAGKVALIFKNYAREVGAVQELYEAHKKDPPIGR